MNEDTRVIVCCYDGDMHQLYTPAYEHHDCPITILSPTDAPAVLDGFDCKFGGKRAYIGQDSLDRQIEHFKIMLTYPENFFLCHDSDSYLLDAKIPDYLYSDPDVVWSNQINDAIPEHKSQFLHGWPHVAFQPPYFLSRKSIEAMVAVASDPHCVASPISPFIDFFMVQLTMVAGLRWRRFLDCVSCCIAADPRQASTLSADRLTTYSMGHQIGLNAVRDGATVIHSVKDPAVVQEFLQERLRFVSGHPNTEPRVTPPPYVGGPPRRRPRFLNQGTEGLKA